MNLEEIPIFYSLFITMILILSKFKGNPETLEGAADEFEAGTACGQSFIRTYVKGLEYLIKCTEKDVFTINEFKASKHKYFVNLEISRHMLSFENVYELENFGFIQKTIKNPSKRPPQAKASPQYIPEEEFINDKNWSDPIPNENGKGVHWEYIGPKY